MPSNIIIKNVRFSYMFADTARANEEGVKKFSTAILIQKDHPQIPEIRALIKKEVEEKWPDPKKRPAGLHNPLRDGDTERNDEAYKGCFFINANAQESSPPTLIDANKQPVQKGYWTSGDYGNVKIDLYPFERTSNKGVGVGLVAIQFIKKGKPLSNRTDPMAGFGVEEVPQDDDSDIFG